MRHDRADEHTAIALLKEKVRIFTEERDWTSAHDAKNLAMCIAIESAEIMEHFQWGERSDYAPEKLSDHELNEIRMEVADVFIYLFSFCNALGIDVATAVTDKININAGRWPVEYNQ